MEAGESAHQRAFGKGLAHIRAGHILRMSPPLVLTKPAAAKSKDIIDKACGDTNRGLLR